MPLKAAQPLPFKHAANARPNAPGTTHFCFIRACPPLERVGCDFSASSALAPPGSALDRHWRAVARPRAMRSSLQASAETLPFDDYSMDTLVMTWTLCTIADVPQALRTHGMGSATNFRAGISPRDGEGRAPRRP